MSTTDVRKFRDGNLSLKPTILNLRGRVGWDSNITKNCGAVDAGPCPIMQATANAMLQQSSNAVCFQCPACGASELSSNQAFQLEDLDRSCKCKSCKANCKVKDWRCGCHIPGISVHDTRSTRIANARNLLAVGLCQHPKGW